MNRIITACSIGALAIACGCSSQPRTNASNTTTQTSATDDRAKLSNEATDMMADAQKARQDIASKDKSGASKLVEQALNDLKDVQARANGKKIVPIYRSIETVTVWQPAAIIPQDPVALKNHTVSSKDLKSQQVGTADRTKAGKLPESAVAGTAAEVTTVAVDVPMASDHLNAAKAALDKNNLKAADSALADAQHAVIAAAVAGDLPLVQAQENLVLAKKRAQAGDWAGAKTALNAASDGLTSYVSASRSPHANDASNLNKQINDYAANIDQDHTDASNRIESWWEQTTDWITPPQQQAKR